MILHGQNCPCDDCLLACELMVERGLIPLNAEWWKTQTAFPVANPLSEGAPKPQLKEPLCLRCKDSGFIVRRNPSSLYRCGYVDVAYPCRCGKAGIAVPLDPAADRKMASAGGAL